MPGVTSLRPRERPRPRGVAESRQCPGPSPPAPARVPDKGPPLTRLRCSPWLRPLPTMKPLPRPHRACGAAGPGFVVGFFARNMLERVL